MLDTEGIFELTIFGGNEDEDEGVGLACGIRVNVISGDAILSDGSVLPNVLLLLFPLLLLLFVVGRVGNGTLIITGVPVDLPVLFLIIFFVPLCELGVLIPKENASLFVNSLW